MQLEIVNFSNTMENLWKFGQEPLQTGGRGFVCSILGGSFGTREVARCPLRLYDRKGSLNCDS